MEKESVTHCFFCAELKCFSKLIHLKSNKEIIRNITIKLSRLNISYDNFDVENLPKMMCVTCIKKLDEAFEFVSGVDKAQVTLKEIYIIKLKKEEILREDQKSDMLGNISDCSIHIKQEDTQFSDSDSSSVIQNKSYNANCERLLSDEVKQSSAVSDMSWNDYLWTCAYCETQFATIEELRTHSMQYHQCCNAFKCYDCSIWKMNLKQFIAHIKSHRKNLKVVCHKCNKTFMFACHLHIHMKTKHATKSNYVCSGCGAEFQTMEELSDHSQAFYKNIRRKIAPFMFKSNMNSLSCVICKKSFKTKETLRAHLFTHTDRQREYTCEKCGKCFLNKHHLAEHIVGHDNVRPYQCKICKISFKTNKLLKQHVSIHNAEKPHICDECGRGFRLKSYLNTHKIVHTDSLPHVCSYCDKKFRFKNLLSNHLRQHTGEKPYSCEICVRKFTNWSNCNLHMKRIHNLHMTKKKFTTKDPSTNKIIKNKNMNESLK